MDTEKPNKSSLDDIVELVNDSEISSIKNIVSGIIKIINDPKSTVKDLNEIIQIDPPLSSRVLRLANSAYYCPPKKISEIIRAIIWVGYDAIKELALSQKVCKLLNINESLQGCSRSSLWKHSISVAMLSKMIYRREYGERGDNMYAAGLLHDIGLIILEQFRQDEFKAILEKLNAGEKDIISIESELLGFDHAELAKAVMESWNIPKELCMAIGNHHNPLDVDKRYSRMTKTLFVADCYCQEIGRGLCDCAVIDRVSYENCLNTLKIHKNALNLIMEDAEKEILKMEQEGFFS